MTLKINSQLFQAASVVYQALLEAPTNRVPNDPQHAWQARGIAEAVYVAAGKDPILTAVAVRCLCGYMKNQVSGHCTQDELVRHGISGAQSLIDAFKGGAYHAPQPQYQQAPQGFQPPQMPQYQAPSMPPVQQMVPPPAPFQPIGPIAPLEVPDFSEGGQS